MAQVDFFSYVEFGAPANEGVVQGILPDGSGWPMSHAYTGGGRTVCGVGLNKEKTLRRLKTNWRFVDIDVICQRCQRSIPLDWRTA